MGDTWSKGGKFDSRKRRREAKKRRERQLKILRKQYRHDGIDESVIDKLLLEDNINFDEDEEL